MHPVKPAGLVAWVPARSVTFEVLRRGDDSLLSMPYRGQRSVLGGLVCGADLAEAEEWRASRKNRHTLAFAAPT
jgi:hypothetical protein